MGTQLDETTRSPFDANHCLVQVRGYSTKRGPNASKEHNRFAWAIRFDGDAVALGVRRAKTRRGAYLDAVWTIGMLREFAEQGLVEVPEGTIGPHGKDDVELWAEWQGIVNPEISRSAKRGRRQPPPDDERLRQLEEERDNLAVELEVYDPVAVRNIVDADSLGRRLADRLAKKKFDMIDKDDYEITREDVSAVMPEPEKAKLAGIAAASLAVGFLVGLLVS